MLQCYCRSWNIECELITPIEARGLFPLVAIEDLKGCLWVPGDGIGDPYKLSEVLIKSAEAKGINKKIKLYSML